MNNKIAGYFVAGILLIILPVSFYFYFDSKVPAPPPAPKEFGPAPYFNLTTQDSTSLSSDDLKGFIYIADFIFTNCESVCPKISELMEKFQESYKDEPRVRFVSFSIDPERDSIKVLKQYSKKYNALENKWFFLTGNGSVIRDSIGVKGFKVPVVPDDPKDGQYSHTDRFILVDGDGIIRGYYGILSEGYIDSLYNGIERVLVEKKHK
jgi:protein SCO1/2